MNQLPTHGHVDGFEVRDNCLCVGRRKLPDVLADIGSTPAYIYDSQLISQRIVNLRSGLPETVKIHYAMKANPMPDVVNLVAAQVDGLDVASAGELEVALSSTTSVSDISFAGPGKTDKELAHAIKAGIVLNVESPNELRRIDTLAKALDQEARLAIRVNPDFELKSSGMRMSGGAKPFGIDAETIPEVLHEYLTPRMQFQGFHIFTGSQNLSADAICEAQRKSMELALQLSDACSVRPKFINLGGGFGVPYFPGDERLDLEPIGKELEQLNELAKARYPEVELIVELGRYIVGEAGIYVTSVVDKKVSRGETFLITNGGMNHHLAASGNFGQVIRKNYPLVVGNRVRGESVVPMNVVGPLCTPLDILGQKCLLPAETDVGDLIVVLMSGAYGLTASPVAFLGHAPPREALI